MLLIKMAEDVERSKMLVDYILIIGFKQREGEMGIVILPLRNVLQRDITEVW